MATNPSDSRLDLEPLDARNRLVTVEIGLDPVELDRLEGEGGDGGFPADSAALVDLSVFRSAVAAL